MNDEYFSETSSERPTTRAAVANQLDDVYGEALSTGPAVLSVEGRGETAALASGPMRIAYVGPSFKIGGVEQHLAGLAKFFDPAVAVLSRVLVTDAARLEGAASVSLPATTAVQVCAKEDLRQRVSDMDLVLVWGDSYDGCFDPDGPTIVYVAHGDCWWTRKGLEGSAGVVHHVIAVSERVQRQQCVGFPSTAILNGVDTSRLSRCRAPGEVRTELGFNAEDFVVGSVGRMTREKQMHLLIEAVRLLPANFKLLLVGGGPRQGELLTLANRRIPGRYAMLRATEYLGDLYQAMDAFALVSEHEGFGLVIAEAMHCRRPVIATDVGCVAEVIEDRINGIVVRPNVLDIRDAVMLIHQHPHWAQGIAAEGHALAERKFHASQMAQRYGRVLVAIQRARQAAQQTGAA